MERCYKTFVSVGNAKQHFSRMLEAVRETIHLLPRPILIQCGHTPFISNDCDVIEFISMDLFVQHVSQAEILILHAGAGSVLHAIHANKYPILMPRRAEFNEHINDHQVGFAKKLQSADKVFMADNTDTLDCGIKKVKEIIHFNSVKNNKSLAFDIIKNRLELILDKENEKCHEN